MELDRSLDASLIRIQTNSPWIYKERSGCHQRQRSESHARFVLNHPYWYSASMSCLLHLKRTGSYLLAAHCCDCSAACYIQWDKKQLPQKFGAAISTYLSLEVFLNVLNIFKLGCRHYLSRTDGHAYQCSWKKAQPQVRQMYYVSIKYHMERGSRERPWAAEVNEKK